MRPIRLFAIASLAFAAQAATGAAMAQAYPSRQINVIVSFPPGGDTDALARLFSEKLAARVGQTVVVENKTGASGTIGNSYVAKANPDGYTLLFT
ncbi:MAG: Bug family tripartite tricarboxylate transporter substrate binding protein, partial [Rhodoferax sp.]